MAELKKSHHRCLRNEERRIHFIMRRVQTLSHADISYIDGAQRILIVGVAVSWGFVALGFAGSSTFTPGDLMLVQFSMAIPYHFLAKYLRQGLVDRWLLPLCCLFPLFGIIIAHLLNQQATDILRRRGFRVGLFGMRRPTTQPSI